MKIAFVSYEFPPDTGIGGIGTYMQQISYAFAERGIDVHVISASSNTERTEKINERLTVHRLLCNNTFEFIRLSPVKLEALHKQHEFDLVEVPEYGAEGLFIKDRLPYLPVIVKLHTPKFLIKEINDSYYNTTAFRKLIQTFKKQYRKENDPEYQALLKADYILSPSISLREIVSTRWNISRDKILHAPNPYLPNKALLQIPYSSQSQTVLYTGRLETRKGVWNLSKAIPLVIKKMPAAKFIFLGRDSRGPYREKSMKSVIKKEIKNYQSQVEFIDHVPLTEIPSWLAKADVCVYPSLWENFPNTCLEAMAAARGIVASAEGGMKDMLTDIQGGMVVDPHNVNAIANAIIQLLSDTGKKNQMAEISRRKITGYYSDSLVDDLINLYKSFEVIA